MPAIDVPLPPSGGLRRGLLLGLVVVLLGVGLGACGGRRSKPDRAAGALAAGLSSADLSAVPLGAVTTADAGQQLSAAVKGMGGVRPVVRVEDVQAKSSDTAVAVLAFGWDLDGSGRDWTYTTSAQLTRRGSSWSVGWSPALMEPSLVAGERLVLRKRNAKRGEIRGADGAVLVTDRPVLRVGIDKTKVAPEQAAASAQRLAERLPGVDAPAFVNRVARAGPAAFVEVIVLRPDDPSAADRAPMVAIPGAVLLPDEVPLAPTRDFARPILGTVGEATAQLITDSAGRLRAGDSTGLSGLQQAHDKQLGGEPGVVVQAVPPESGAGRPRELFRRDPVPGQPVAITLDQALQTSAEALVAPVKVPSAIVAVRPSTGEVVAAASGPGGQGYSTATLGRYAPGSAFKVVTTLGLLRAGLTQGSVVPCTPTVTVDGRSFKNYDDYPAAALGDISLRAALANSCNTALIAQRSRVPQAALAEAAASLGIGSQADLGVPSFAGSVPAEAAETEHAASMIGQGRLQVSPLTMAVVAASLAQGTTVTPRILQPGPTSRTEAIKPVGPAEAEEVRKMMRAVVTDGSGSFLKDVPGEQVAAKTGTAEYGTGQPPRTHAWMIAIQGDLAVAVFVEDGASGSKTAGPILEEFLRGTG